jgi:hypothetical protein
MSKTQDRRRRVVTTNQDDRNEEKEKNEESASECKQSSQHSALLGPRLQRRVRRSR